MSKASRVSVQEVTGITRRIPFGRMALAGAALSLLAACHQYPMEYGSAKVKASMSPRASDLTTQASAWPWQSREMWLDQYVIGVNFEVGSDRLDPLDRIRISEFVEGLNIWEPEVFVEGHADSTGTAALNRDLAERRAESVRRALVDAGLKPHQITIKSFGDRSPIATNVTQEGRKKNRRAVIIVTPRGRG